MTILLLSLLTTLQQENSYAHITGRATTYWPNDGHCGPRLADGARFHRESRHIAHRTLPLGTTGHLCSIRTGLCVLVSVRDRGPFGASIPCSAANRDPSKLRFRTRVGHKPRLVRWGKRRDGSYRVCYWWQAQIKLKSGWRRRGEFDLTRPVAKAIGHRAFGQVVFFYKKPRRDET